jgi:hypothetical protein
MSPRNRAFAMIAALVIFVVLALFKTGQHHYAAALAFTGLAMAQLAALLDDRRGPREMIPARWRIAAAAARRLYLAGIAVTVAGLALAIARKEMA